MSDNIPTIQGSVPAVFAGVSATEANAVLTKNMGGGFGVVSIRGKVWRIKHGGNEVSLLTPNREAIPSLEVVLLELSENVSKIYYAKDFKEGDTATPDCYSGDGIRPDPAIAQPQNPDCATCRHNAWGSKVTPAGTPVKACGDSLRMAVVPLADIANEQYGGPMLLRIQPGSWKNLRAYTTWLNGQGFPYFAVATRIGFDPNASYPMVTFNPIRVLNDTEAAQVDHLKRTSETLRGVLHQVGQEFVDAAQPQQPQGGGLAFEQPPQATAPSPQPANPPIPVPAEPVPQPAPQPAAPGAFGGFVPGQEPQAPQPAPQPAVEAQPAPPAAPAVTAAPAPEAQPAEPPVQQAPEDMTKMIQDLIGAPTQSS